MPEIATSNFVVENRTGAPAAWEGGQLSHTRWDKRFTGELVGTSVVEAIMLGLDDGGPRAYVGVERFAGTVHGRAGTFVLLHTASMQGDKSTASWTIVEGSGTGELAGLRGAGVITPGHELILTYEL